MVQLSFFPIHLEVGGCGVGLWKGEGQHGEFKLMSPSNTLAVTVYHLPVDSKSTSDYVKFKQGFEFICREAGCLWFLDFVRRLVGGSASADDFLADYRLHNNGEEPRSDAKYYVFL